MIHTICEEEYAQICGHAPGAACEPEYEAVCKCGMLVHHSEKTCEACRN